MSIHTTLCYCTQKHFFFLRIYPPLVLQLNGQRPYTKQSNITYHRSHDPLIYVVVLLILKPICNKFTNNSLYINAPTIFQFDVMPKSTSSFQANSPFVLSSFQHDIPYKLMMPSLDSDNTPQCVACGTEILDFVPIVYC